MAKAKTPDLPALSYKQSLWLLGAAFTVFVPLLPYLPTWLDILVMLIFFWRAWLLWQRLSLPPRWELTLLSLAGFGAIAIQFHTVFGRSAGVALLALMLALKLLESRSSRDGLAVILLCLFMLLTQFIYSQSLFNALLMVGSAIVVTAALIVLNHEHQPARHTLRLATLMLAQATPFMLILFLLFPRISGPLWGLPSDAHGALTGLSDSMSPGSISQVSRSDAIAFRVKFAAADNAGTIPKPPPQNILYWRGPVLASFDGRTWQIGRMGNLIKLADPEFMPYAISGTPVNYTVTLEPHNRTWLFALELPGTMPQDAIIASNFQLHAKTPVRSRLRYEMRSFPEIVAGRDERVALLNEARQLPAGSNPRTIELARQWRNETGDDDEALLRRALDYYRRQHFTYTLSPPLLGEHSVDEFLFDTRRGFCEHFSSSFVFLMRAAGIPARVVTGYQGGELNPVDGTLIVRQWDAHAWTEVWIKGRGWLRVDPTAMSVPARIETNLAAALPADEALPWLARTDLSWLHNIRFRWDALTNTWNQWVLGYNPQRQRELLSSLGMRAPDWKSMTKALTALCAMVLICLMLWAMRQRRQSDPALAAWNRLSKKLARRGLERHAWEGPADYAKRIFRILHPTVPELAAEINSIADLYILLRYSHAVAKQQLLKELQGRIARIDS